MMVEIPMRVSVSMRSMWWASRQNDHDRRAYLRIGQDFFNYFQCHKVTEPTSRAFLDKLYEMDGNEALEAIASIIDFEN